MHRGNIVYFIDVERQRSLVSPRLPLSIYRGVVLGVGSSLVSLKTKYGVICFDLSTQFSQAKDYKMFIDLKLARRIIGQRRKRIEAAR